MEEKYRYFDGSRNMDKCIFVDGQSDEYIDNLSEACDLLNQQYKHIKELESKLRVSNSLNASLSLDYNELKKQYDSQEKLLTIKLAENSKLTLENQQLENQLENLQKLNGETIILNRTVIKHSQILEKENKSLKLSQKRLAIENLETLKNSLIIFQQAYSDTSLTVNYVEQIINNQIKELKGEK